MPESLLGPIISAIIAGVFQLLAKRMELRHSKTDASTDKGTTTSEINQSKVLIHIGMIQFMVNLSGFVLGNMFGPTQTYFVLQLFIGTAVGIAAFRWSALQIERASRWKHLVIVAIGVAITTLIVNSLMMGTALFLFMPSSYMFALAQSFFAMAVGGYLADKSET